MPAIPQRLQCCIGRLRAANKTTSVVGAVRRVSAIPVIVDASL